MRAVLLAVTLLALIVPAGWAAEVKGLPAGLPGASTTAAPPAAPADRQAEVDAIADAVIARLAARMAGAPSEPAAPPEPASKKPQGGYVMPNLSAGLSVSSGAIARNAAAIVDTLSQLPDNVAEVLGRSAGSLAADRDPIAAVAQVVTSLLVVLIVPWGIARAARHFRGTVLARRQGLAEHALLFGLDIVAVAGMTVTALVFAETWYADLEHAGYLMARTVLAIPVLWRIMMLPVDLILRATEGRARLLPLPDGAARTARRYCSFLFLSGLVLVGLGAVLHRRGLSDPHAHALAILTGVIIAIELAYGLVRGRAAIDRLLAVGARATNGRLIDILAERWYGLALAYLALMLAAWVAGVLARNLSLFEALGRSVALVFLAWLAARFVSALGRELFDERGATDSDPRAALFRRCCDTGIWMVTAALMIEVWVVGLLGFVDAEDWARVGRAILSAGITLFIAYVAWQVVAYKISRHLAEDDGVGHPIAPGETPKAATRLRTMLPLLRIFLLGTVAVLGSLIVLTELGIDTAPLIAGASVLGLAISFGSQALIKDIVSGIFFMADDAFRVGEYIDTGRLKGTVEGMSIRSLRVRHQNGQVHTIPFGQLQSVTNFSRDWLTVKFNVRFARDTDLEALRKTTKKIGEALMTDAEIGPEVIMPLKLQGVADIEQSALVCRFKFTTRPGKPTWVQRRYLKEMYERFPVAGIRFADSSVNVTGLSIQPTDPATVATVTAVAAASTSLPSAQPNAGTT